MALWLVRAGKYGENEHYALEKNLVTIGWNEMPDISTISAKKDLENLYLSINPNVKRMHMIRMVGQMWPVKWLGIIPRSQFDQDLCIH